jgi:cytochrome c biogenesis protein CcmG/thiol:disulfide interchange protein DsbE
MVERLRAGRWGWPSLLVLVAALVSACGRDAQPASEPGGEGELARLDFTLKDMNGQDVRLSDFKGRPLLVNFWATWCGPCKHEIPAFVELVEKYKAQKFTVLGISTDDKPEDLRPFAADYKMNYPVLVGLGRDDVLVAYEAVFAIPVSWFVRADGTVYLKHPGPATKEWFETQIKALLALPEAE